MVTTPTPDQLEFLNELRDAVFANAKAKGFHDQLALGLTEEQWGGPVGALIRASVFTANLHGESSEFWEAFRAGKLNEPCDKAAKMAVLGLPAITCAEEEIADVIIRALDTAASYGIDIAKAIAVKMAYNASRPHLHGGKKA